MCWSWLLPPSHHTFHHMQINQITLITANMHPTKQPISATISSINPPHSTAAAVHLDSHNVSFPPASRYLCDAGGLFRGAELISVVR